MKPVADSPCVFSVKLGRASFSVPGEIYLTLSISSLLNRSLLNEVIVQSGDSEEEVKNHTFTTETVSVSPSRVEEVYHFRDAVITFYLPKGLCQEEKGKEVTLNVKAHDKSKSAVIGESTFLVYPRTSGDSSLPAPSDEVYSQLGELLLVKQLTEESIALLVGKVKYEASLRQQNVPSPDPSTPTPVPSPNIVPTPSPEPQPEPEVEPQPDLEPEPEPEPEPKPKEPTPPPPPPPPVVEVPKKRERSGPSGLVARPKQEEIEVIVHAASGLAPLPNHSAPRPYVLGKIHVPGKQKATPSNKEAWQSTHSTLNFTTSPLWEDVIYPRMGPVTGDKPEKDAVLQLKIVDKPSKFEMCNFDLPVSILQPFHQYHLDLVQTTQSSPNGLHLFASVYRKLSSLPDHGDFSFSGLEVRLVSLDKPLASHIGSVMAVAKIVPDYQNYRDAFRDHTEMLSLQPLAVECPVPHISSFLTSRRGKHQGYAQLWLSDASNSIHPLWNHSFVFSDTREVASMFVSTAAVVIELYDTNSAFDGKAWSPHHPLGFAVVLLDNRVYNALTDERGRNGVRVIHLPIQASRFPCHSKQTPTLSLVLRLLTAKVPDSQATVSHLENLPTLDGFVSPEPEFPALPPVVPTEEGLKRGPSPTTPPTTPPPIPLYAPVIPTARRIQPLDDGGLPPRDAIQNLLESDPRDRLVQPSDRSAPSTKGLIPTRMPPPPPAAATPPAPHNDQTLMNLIDSQQREIDSYRQAMKRMGEEVVQLQDALARLEADNSLLRQQANMYEDTTRAMVTDAKLEGMSKAEMLEKYVTLKRALSKQVSEAANYREKLLHAQNELIKHNDREKQYLEQQEATASQSRLLQERQDKVKKLERTCREQEKALEKMERALKSRQTKQSVSFKEDSRDAELLGVENAKLKAEIEHLRATSAQKSDSANEAEKIRMQFMLEKAEGRVSSLEQELLEKAKEWGKEKANISLRTNDHQRQHSLPPLPYYDRGKQIQDFDDRYGNRSYGSRRPRLGYSTPTRLSPLY
ncbi:coiled-coil domain-containing protein 33-like [Diadema antillarum]|uniref:coiled-coil domain-containing protein 33-like n=1 Tax=Diadema antillarum TaxID=105358 RepID=UPI003A83A253